MDRVPIAVIERRLERMVIGDPGLQETFSFRVAAPESAMVLTWERHSANSSENNERITLRTLPVRYILQER